MSFLYRDFFWEIFTENVFLQNWHFCAIFYGLFGRRSWNGQFWSPQKEAKPYLQKLLELLNFSMS